MRLSYQFGKPINGIDHDAPWVDEPHFFDFLAIRRNNSPRAATNTFRVKVRGYEIENPRFPTSSRDSATFGRKPDWL